MIKKTSTFIFILIVSFLFTSCSAPLTGYVSSLTQLYEKAQGDLISMERVKARAESESSEGADNIAKNAASRMGVLSKDERENKKQNNGIIN